MTDVSGFTLAESARTIGCSVGYLRKQIRKGTIRPAKVQGKRGVEYRLSPADLEAVTTAYRTPKQGHGNAEALVQLAALRQEHDALIARAVKAETEADAMVARVNALQQELAAERQRVEAEHKRVEALKSLSAWDRLRGKHKGV